jgi:hypothetical protein
MDLKDMVLWIWAIWLTIETGRGLLRTLYWTPLEGTLQGLPSRCSPPGFPHKGGPSRGSPPRLPLEGFLSTESPTGAPLQWVTSMGCSRRGFCPAGPLKEALLVGPILGVTSRDSPTGAPPFGVPPKGVPVGRLIHGVPARVSYPGCPL